jgi:hypothetical protein
VERLVDKLIGYLFAVVVAMLGTAAAVAEGGEYPLPLPPEVQWQDSAGATYTAIGSLQVEQITQEKLDACLKASGNHKFCHCLAGKLPVGLTFDGYIQSVTKSRQQLGYDAFSNNEKKMIDMAFAVRNQCVPNTGGMLALADEQVRPVTPTTASATAGGKKEMGGPAATAAKIASAKPALSRSYLVQVASFKHPEDALAMKSRLASHGMEAHTKVVDLPRRGRWHRVYLGPYAKRDMAEQVKTEVQAQLQLSAWVKRDRP